MTMGDPSELGKVNATTDPSDAVDDPAKRKFVQLASKLAIYTPPAMMALASPSVQAIAQSAVGKHHKRRPGAKKVPVKKRPVAKKKAAAKKRPVA